jgi:exodeoxyribonuclease VII small subunit
VSDARRRAFPESAGPVQSVPRYAVPKDPQTAAPAPEKYDELVHRLEELVKRLEGGQLTLEDSLRAFEEGMGLVDRGEKILDQAEKRIEELTHRDGEARAVPLQLPSAQGQAAPSGARPPAPPPAAARPARPPADDEDVPF